jgi:shikimate dehydrogenase
MPDLLSGATRLFPIIGDPIRYVESPLRLTRTFGARDYNGMCVPMQVPADDVDIVMAGLRAARNVDGILVTMPHKFTAFAHCATSSERAKMLGVVSVIRRNPDERWHGDMLDGLAFVKAQKDQGARPEGRGYSWSERGARAARSPSRCLRRGFASLSFTTPTRRGSRHCSICSPTLVRGG